MAGPKTKSQDLTERGKFWQKHLKAWSKTSLSQAEYCRRYNLSQPAFGWWKRILLPNSNQIKPKQARLSKRTTRTKKKSFIEVEMADVNRFIGQSAYNYEICLSHNSGIRLSDGFDESVLKRLIGILEQRC